MTKIGMTYEEWRVQFGNPLGLVYDAESKGTFIVSAALTAREGMFGYGASGDGPGTKIPSYRAVPMDEHDLYHGLQHGEDNERGDENVASGD